MPGAKVDSSDPSVPCVTLPNGTVKPLFGKGSGRGRKKCVCVYVWRNFLMQLRCYCTEQFNHLAIDFTLKLFA